MDERRLNIEEWLRQAADRQQGTHTPEAEKQQAWQQLHSMLDADGAPPVGTRSWMWIVDIVLLFVTGLLMVWPGIYSDVPERGDPFVQGKEVNVRGDEGSSGVTGQKDESGEIGDRKDTGAKSAENEDRKDGNTKNAKNGDQEDRSAKNEDPKDGNTKNAKNGDQEDRSARNVKNEDPKDGSEKSSESGNLKDSENGDPEKNEHINVPKSGKRNNRKTGENTGNGEGTGGNKLDTGKRNIHKYQMPFPSLSTAQRFPPKIASDLSRVKERRIGYSSSPIKIKDLPSSAFSMNISMTLPADGQYGVNLAAEYNYRLWNTLFIRPRAGVSYIHAGNRKYSHSAYFPRADTVPDPTSFYWVDSLVTDYSVKSIVYGVAGLQVAYRYKKLEIFTGIAYRHQLTLTGSDSSYTQSRMITGTPPAYQRERFSKNRLPGRTNLQWQAGLNYMLNRSLQAGASYNILLQKSTAQKGLDTQVAMPVSSSVELHLRWFFRRK